MSLLRIINSQPRCAYRLLLSNKRNSIQQSCIAGFTHLAKASFSTASSIRSPKDSKKIKILDFAKDEGLRAKYINPYGELRFGLILEELDSLAGGVAYSHALPKSTIDSSDPSESALDQWLIKPRPNQPFKKFESDLTIVTASCNRIQLFKRLEASRVTELEGVVTWVGKSSMEIRIQVNQIHPQTNVPVKVIEAFFTMVARNKANIAVSVPPLQPTNPEEELLFAEGAEHSQLRKLAAKVSLQNKPPSDEERQLIHDKWNETKSFVSHQPTAPFPVEQFVYMNETLMQSTILMQPQERNIHNKIFGGYLMRKAFELAWCNAWIYSGGTPAFKAIDDTYFLAPVEIGDIVVFTSQVIFTSGSALLVNVAADVISGQHAQLLAANKGDASSGSSENPLSFSVSVNQARKRTNTFNFSFECRHNKNVRQVLPRTYEEVVLWTSGRRELMKVKPESMTW